MRAATGTDERRLLATVPLLALPNFSGAVVVFLLQNVVVPGAGATDVSLRRATIAFVAYIAVSFPIAAVLSYVILRPALRWLRAGRAPTDEEVTATVTAPRRLASMAFAFWLGSLGVFAGLAVADGDPAAEIARDAVATILGGLTSGVMSFLLLESMLRPVVARALAGRMPGRRRTAGIAARILASWALGSAVPMLAIAGAQLRLGDDLPRPSPAATALLAVLGLGSGALMLTLAARSVAQPIAAVRSALRRVQRGDVDVEVPVDDVGEIGQLQAGLNEMVRGLRDRRRLEDLFGRYVGPEVAADALDRGVDLGGEAREVSALFVDLAQSTEFTAGRDPSAVVAALNDFFSTVVSVVTAEGGWVNKFAGDGALCVFGAPAGPADHATRALRAARLLHERLGDLSATRGLRAGIGVSSGTVVAGHVGATERFEYTVVGAPVNEAARLTDAAKETASCVLAARATIDAASEEERALWSPAGTLHLRGLPDGTDVFAPA
ncbi:MAG TPA: adenylate/guanylate cyclase domain-containing protein [Acidimicrobiales bacterium]|nr:adenylate/guanylate cyclase domain-containing protein [Acidimicrobiales bacterium]